MQGRRQGKGNMSAKAYSTRLCCSSRQRESLAARYRRAQHKLGAAGEVTVDLNQGQSPPDSHWRTPGRSHGRSYSLEPGDDSHAPDSLLASAEQFITLFHSENRAGPPDRRLRHVRQEIETTGTYRQTAEELGFGGRVAWRNSFRCIGRLYWRSLRVRDCREVTAAPDIAAES